MLTMQRAIAIYQSLGFQSAPQPDDLPEVLRLVILFMACELEALGEERAL